MPPTCRPATIARGCNVDLRLDRQLPRCRQVLFVSLGTCIVGSEKPGRAVAVMHLTQVRCASKDVVARVEGIEPKPWRERNSSQVSGMICINPSRLDAKTAHTPPALSVIMTALIQSAVYRSAAPPQRRNLQGTYSRFVLRLLRRTVSSPS